MKVVLDKKLTPELEIKAMITDANGARIEISFIGATGSAGLFYEESVMGDLDVLLGKLPAAMLPFKGLIEMGLQAVIAGLPAAQA